MKRNIILKALSMLLIPSVMMVSCSEDFLDKTPEGEFVEDNFYDSDDALYASTAPLYNRAWFDYNTRGMLLLGSLRANDAYSPYNWPEYGMFTVTALNEYLSDIWAGFFSVVTMANATIDNINDQSTDNVSEDAKKTAISEARLMRSTALFYARPRIRRRQPSRRSIRTRTRNLLERKGHAL